MLQRVWEDVPAHDGQVATLAADLGVPSVISRLLWQRGLTDIARAQAFLNPGIDQLNDPFLMLGMRVAVDRILGAIARQEASERIFPSIKARSQASRSLGVDQRAAAMASQPSPSGTASCGALSPKAV